MTYDERFSSWGFLTYVLALPPLTPASQPSHSPHVVPACVQTRYNEVMATINSLCALHLGRKNMTA